eukprot:7009109-Alexandrium_andersonii.AAC.1
MFQALPNLGVKLVSAGSPNLSACCFQAVATPKRGVATPRRHAFGIRAACKDHLRRQIRDGLVRCPPERSNSAGERPQVRAPACQRRPLSLTRCAGDPHAGWTQQVSALLDAPGKS